MSETTHSATHCPIHMRYTEARASIDAVARYQIHHLQTCRAQLAWLPRALLQATHGRYSRRWRRKNRVEEGEAHRSAGSGPRRCCGWWCGATSRSHRLGRRGRRRRRRGPSPAAGSTPSTAGSGSPCTFTHRGLTPDTTRRLAAISAGTARPLEKKRRDDSTHSRSLH